MRVSRVSRVSCASRPKARARRFGAMMAAVAVAVAPALGGCGGRSQRPPLITTSSTTTATVTAALPGTGKPPVQVGDKNTTEQFVLGQLYLQSLQAQGYTVAINRNIGPTQVTMQALHSGTLSLYPEYLNVWNTAVAGNNHRFDSVASAFQAGQRWALAHGYELLNPSPFSDTAALAVDFNYGLRHNLTQIGDLRRIQRSLTLGAPPQFQTAANGLPAIEKAYRVKPAAFDPLEIGGQYQALSQGTVQVADVNTTDGQLITGNYTLLADPRGIFGFGNVVPVVPINVIKAEGPQFAATLNRVSALLTMSVIRQLNAAVDVANQDPKKVAFQFLQSHGLLAPTDSGG
jgi:osmoprotectant transport system substrate-binding protein